MGRGLSKLQITALVFAAERRWVRCGHLVQVVYKAKRGSYEEYVDRPAASRALRRLEQRGLLRPNVRRSYSRTWGRAYGLTDAGWAYLQPHAPSQYGAEQQAVILERWAAEDRERAEAERRRREELAAWRARRAAEQHTP